MQKVVRWTVLTLTVGTLSMFGFMGAGCRRIPDHVMNSPPATHRPGREEAAPVEAEPERPEPDLSPENLRPAPHPDDRLASYERTSSVEKIAHEELSQVAVDALARIGRPAVRPLIAELDSNDASQRKRAAQALARIGPAAADAAEPLVQRLEDPQETPEVQLACAEALKELGPKLWPEKPQPYVPTDLPQPLPPLEEGETENPQLALLAERRVAMRIDYEARNDLRQREYQQQLLEYGQRKAVAERAIQALKQLALETK